MRNTKQRSDGYYTVGMQDYSFTVPDNQLIGCVALCGSKTYPDPQPGDESPTADHVSLATDITVSVDWDRHDKT